MVDKSNLLRSKIATLASRLSAVQCAGLRVKDLEVQRQLIRQTERSDFLLDCCRAFPDVSHGVSVNIRPGD